MVGLVVVLFTFAFPCRRAECSRTGRHGLSGQERRRERLAWVEHHQAKFGGWLTEENTYLRTYTYICSDYPNMSVSLAIICFG